MVGKNFPACAVTLVSFGYLHDTAPEADLTLDVRRYLPDPAAARDVLDVDGRDPTVQDIVTNTPGAIGALAVLHQFVTTFPTDSCMVAVGCAGGRHRSVALVEVLAVSLDPVRYAVRVEHRHVHLPRVPTNTPSEHADDCPGREHIPGMVRCGVEGVA